MIPFGHYRAACARRDSGMEAAAAHAEAFAAGWTFRACDAVLRLVSAGRIEKPHLVEDIRAMAYERGLDHPPNEKAWGAVVARLVRDRVIRHEGFGVAKTSNLSPKKTWVRYGVPT